MGSNPINLAVRFLLELSSLIAMGILGYRQTDGLLRFLLAIGIPILASVVWGTFAVLDDPSRSGRAPKPVSGVVRLVIEFFFFGFGAWAIFNMDYSKFGLIFAIIIVIHYILSYDRITWLISR